MLRYLLMLLLIIINVNTQLFSNTIPPDPDVKIGKLPNGVKYYIKHNVKPEKRVEMRLAVNAGSVLENNSQVGLAHFTEHMAFNGTKNFAKNDLISYLQSVGVKFGADLNAYTSFDETVYMLTLPTDKPDILHKGFQVLEDWGHNISFDSIEIEKERGVVIEEWRIGRGADQRMRDKFLPVVFYQSKYAERLPIGTKENLETFNHDSLKQFYYNWYRPDQMAVVVVGDIDVNWAEEQIKEHFSQIPVKPNAPIRQVFTMPDHEQTLVSVCSDKEATSTSVAMFYKYPADTSFSTERYRKMLMANLYFTMLNQRMYELTREPNPPYLYASASSDNISRTCNAFILSALIADTNIVAGLKALLTETQRAKLFGFTKTELERAKKELLSNYEQAYHERDKTESSAFASEYIRNFLTNETMPGITWEYNFTRNTLPEINIDEINKLTAKLMRDSSRVIVVTAPHKPEIILPAENQLIDVVKNISDQTLSAYTDSLDNEKLLNNIPPKGKIVTKQKLKKIGFTLLTLSNGVEVYLKPTKFKNDEILFSAFSKGGQSLYPDSDHFSAAFSVNATTEGGLNGFSVVQLQKLLAGKNASVVPYIGMYSEGFRGSATPADLETMLQLLYLYFTAPKLDSMAFVTFIEKQKVLIKNALLSPTRYYSDQINRILCQNNPRGGAMPTEQNLNDVKLYRAFEIYKQRFANAADFKFIFVGNFNIDSISLLLETYVASLPYNNNTETFTDLGIRPPQQTTDVKIKKGQDAKSIVTLVITDTATYNRPTAYKLKSMVDALNIRLIEVLREEKSGVYGVGASASMSRIPYENYSITVRFPCAPENADSLTQAVWLILNDIKQNGISQANLKKVKETQLRELEVQLENNGFWLSYIESVLTNNQDPYFITYKKKEINNLKSEDLQQVANKFITDKYIRMVLLPE